MLRKEDSNKILKSVKVVLFATSLSLLNPMNIEAQEVNQNTQEEYSEEKNLYLICASTSTLTGIALGTFFGLRSKKKEEETNNLNKNLSNEYKDNSNRLVKKLTKMEGKHE